MFNNTDSKYKYIGLDQRMSMSHFIAPSVSFDKEGSVNNIADNTSDIRIKKEDNPNYTHSVYFRDPVDHSYINVNLSSENLEKLKTVFGSSSLKQERGKTLLSGNAENFVASWYADIAYKRDYIGADSDNDGFLSQYERKNTHSFSEGYKMFNVGDNVFLLSKDKFYMKFSSINSQDETRINQYTSSFIEEELNRMISLDKNLDNSLSLDELWQGKYTQYLDEAVDEMRLKLCAMGVDFSELFYALLKIVKDSGDMLKDELQRLGIDVKNIDLNASPEEVFKQVMQEVKDKINLDDKLTDEDKNTFNEIAKLTKLDKNTLAYNLANNANFEEDIISIVQELRTNISSYAAKKNLNINA